MHSQLEKYKALIKNSVGLGLGVVDHEVGLGGDDGLDVAVCPLVKGGVAVAAHRDAGRVVAVDPHGVGHVHVAAHVGAAVGHDVVVLLGLVLVGVAGLVAVDLDVVQLGVGQVGVAAHIFIAIGHDVVLVFGVEQDGVEVADHAVHVGHDVVLVLGVGQGGVDVAAHAVVGIVGDANLHDTLLIDHVMHYFVVQSNK